MGFGVIEKAGKAKKRAELSGRRGEAREKTACRKTIGFSIIRSLVNGKYLLVSILKIVDSCQSNNIELTSGVNMAPVKECVAKALKTLNILRNNQRKIILKEQEVAAEELLLGKDVLAVLPTGFGKSMIFTIFVLARQEMLKRLEKDAATCVLIISPLASMISDQIAEMQSLGFNALEHSEKTLTEVI